ncbi:MAG: hypothetical protein ACFFG0_04325 [Candidatus Thorarchaeota archaeon]
MNLDREDIFSDDVIRPLEGLEGLKPTQQRIDEFEELQERELERVEQEKQKKIEQERRKQVGEYVGSKVQHIDREQLDRPDCRIGDVEQSKRCKRVDEVSQRKLSEQERELQKSLKKKKSDPKKESIWKILTKSPGEKYGENLPSLLDIFLQRIKEESDRLKSGRPPMPWPKRR